MVVDGCEGGATARVRALLAGVLLVLAFAAAAPGAPPEATEHELKAAFLFNFVKFVEWPPEALDRRASLEVCVLGDDLLHEALQRSLRGKTVRDKPIATRRIASLQATGECHVLFVSSAHHDDMPAIVPLVRLHHVLLVGEGPRFLAAGGTIAFDVENDRLRFDVDTDAATGAGLKLSSQLLKVARNVSRKGGS